jgi:hypothetical protein
MFEITNDDKKWFLDKVVAAHRSDLTSHSPGANSANLTKKYLFFCNCEPFVRVRYCRLACYSQVASLNVLHQALSCGVRDIWTADLQ